MSVRIKTLLRATTPIGAIGDEASGERLARRLFLAGLACVAVEGRAGLVEVIARVKPSIAAVGIFNPVAAPRFAFRGTGFVVGDGNLLVTNAHVLPEPGSGGEPAGRLALQFIARSGLQELRTAALVAQDRAHDLVVLRFDGAPMPALTIADANGVREGQAIAIIGFPIGGVLGFTPVTHRGIIASITAVAMPSPNSNLLNPRTARQLREGSFDVYQLDATAYPGNSGGPVLDAETGEVVGVINMVLVKSTKESALSQPTGISYAIPARFVEEILRRK